MTACLSVLSASAAARPRVTLLQAYYSTRLTGGLFHTTLYAPSNTGIPVVVDDAPPGTSSKQSKQYAALQVGDRHTLVG